MLDIIRNCASYQKNIVEDTETLLLIDSDLHLEVNVENSNFHLEIVILSNEEKNIKLTGFINLAPQAQGDIVIVDFSHSSLQCEIEGLLKDHTQATYHIASSCTKQFKKVYDVKLNVEGVKTKSLVKMDGVVLDSGNLSFLGSTTIKKGAIKSNARQEGRIADLSLGGKAQVSPILNIDENDILASHGAALGKVSEDVLFYLMSRGLSKMEATSLITIGYLKPIVEMIRDENTRTNLLSLVNTKEF